MSRNIFDSITNALVLWCSLPINLNKHQTITLRVVVLRLNKCAGATVLADKLIMIRSARKSFWCEEKIFPMHVFLFRSFFYHFFKIFVSKNLNCYQ